MLDNRELKYGDTPKHHAEAMVVSLVSRTCCPVSMDGEVHEVEESELDDDLEFTEENENELNESSG